MQSVSVSSAAMHDASWPLVCYCITINRLDPPRKTDTRKRAATEKFSTEIETEASINTLRYKNVHIILRE